MGLFYYSAEYIIKYKFANLIIALHLQSSKLDPQLKFECLNADLLDDIGQVLHGSSSTVHGTWF